MKSGKSRYILESSEESARLDRQSRMAAFDFKSELRFLEVREGDRILDAGCGSGIVSSHLATLAPGVSVVGWDISPNQVEAAKARYGAAGNLAFAQRNLLEPTEADGPDAGNARFDKIVCRYVLRHFNSEDVQRVIRNLSDSLKPGGTIYCVDVDGVMGEVFSGSPFLKKALRRIREAREVDFQVARKMPSLLLKHGFQDVDWNAMSCQFKGEELAQETENLRQSVRNAETFVKKILGGDAAFTRFQDEYFAALREPGFVLCYTKVVAMGTKPKARPRLVTRRG